jgi:hypothetical protein
MTLTRQLRAASHSLAYASSPPLAWSKTAMDKDSRQPVEAEETCKVLEQAVLKYFPRPVENMESADSDGSADPRSEPSKASPSTVLFAVRRSLSFLCLPHPF